MRPEDVDKRCRVFDRPDDPYSKGLVGTVTEVYDEFNFRFRTDNGTVYEFSIKNVKVKFLEATQ